MRRVWLSTIAMTLHGCLSFPATGRCDVDTDCALGERCVVLTGRCVAGPDGPRHDASGDAQVTPPSDGAVPGPDGVTPGPDGAAPGPDGATPPSDGAVPGSDGATPPPDGAVPRSDGAIPASDAVVPERDAGPADALVAVDANTPAPLRWLAVSAGGAEPDFLPGVEFDLHTGSGHTCAISETEQLFCWGNNTQGQLGVGANVPRANRPQAVHADPPTARWAKVSAGMVHTCAIRAADDPEAGALYCWGSGEHGRLGDAALSVGGSNVPARIGGDDDWTDVSAGGAHTCGIRGGTLYCWGMDDLGQAGDPANGDDLLSPHQVAGEGYVSVDVGLFFTCALTGAHEIYCFGGDDYGQSGAARPPQPGANNDVLDCRGDPGPSSDDCVLVPHLVGPDRSWTALAVGDYHACALDDQGEAACWGRNEHGDIGDWNLVQDGTAAPFPLPQRGGYLGVSAGGMTTCARDRIHTTCYGRGEFGELGNGAPDVASDSATEPLIEPALGRWTQISLGGQHGCALSDLGELGCFGSTEDGQVGTGRYTSFLEPTPVPFDQPVTQVALGEPDVGCLVSNGDIYCWGDATEGLFFDQVAGHASVPTQVTRTGHFVEVVTGRRYACGRTDANDTICWGKWDAGALGNGEQQPVGDFFTLPAPMNGRTVAGLTAGQGSACRTLAPPGILVDDVAVECWGNNSEGQVGPGGLDAGPTVPMPVSWPTPFQAVAVSEIRAYALDWAGHLLAWGGAPGMWDPDFDPALRAEIQGPLQLGAGADYTSLSARDYQVCVLAPPAVAGNPTIQCGQDYTPDQYSAANFSVFPGVPYGPGHAWGSVVAGPDFVCGLDSAGRAYCTGYGSLGQLGDGLRANREPNELRAVLGTVRFSALSAGYTSVCGIATNGDRPNQLYCWGAGHRGENAMGGADADAPEVVSVPAP